MATDSGEFEVVAEQELLQLEWQDRDGVLVVTPSDQRRFKLKVGLAIEILRQHARGETVSLQFDILIQSLVTWLQAHRGRWEKAFLTAGENTLRFIVVRKQVAFEGDITDSLSDLGIQVANDPDLDLIRLTTRALPLVSQEELHSFLDSSLTIELNGERTQPHSAGE